MKKGIFFLCKPVDSWDLVGGGKFRDGRVEMRLIVWKILLRNVGKPSLEGCLDLEFLLARSNRKVQMFHQIFSRKKCVGGNQ